MEVSMRRSTDIPASAGEGSERRDDTRRRWYARGHPEEVPRVLMVCSNCGAQNDAGRKFCAECGMRLATACSACGSANPASAKFCGECGTTLGGAAGVGPAAAAVAASRAPEIKPAAELKLVSILFADLVGFTMASEKRDPE